MALSNAMPSGAGCWNTLRPEIIPAPPARLLMTAVRIASRKSFWPDAPPLLINPVAAHVTVCNRIPAQIDRMIAGEFRIHALVMRLLRFFPAPALFENRAS